MEHGGVKKSIPCASLFRKKNHFSKDASAAVGAIPQVLHLQLLRLKRLPCPMIMVPSGTIKERFTCMALKNVSFLYVFFLKKLLSMTLKRNFIPSMAFRLFSALNGGKWSVKRP